MKYEWESKQALSLDLNCKNLWCSWEQEDGINIPACLGHAHGCKRVESTFQPSGFMLMGAREWNGQSKLLLDLVHLCKGMELTLQPSKPLRPSQLCQFQMLLNLLHVNIPGLGAQMPQTVMYCGIFDIPY
eukprot:1149432-Pelagomonas_calceolata.AAC.2